MSRRSAVFALASPQFKIVFATIQQLMSPKIVRHPLYRILIGLGLLVLLLRLANWSVKHGHSLPPPPKPNGYDMLLVAANQLQPLPPDWTEMSPDQIRQLADQNRPALEQARKAMQIEGRVSLQPTRAWDDHHEEELAALKRLAGALSLEARTQLLNQHTNDAAGCDLDALRLADSMRKGGIILDGINSLAVEVIGAALLQAKLPQLDAQFCHATALELEALESRREMPEAIFATEKEWSAIRFGLIDLAGRLLMKKENEKRQAKFRGRDQEITHRTQHLMLRLAARAYELENHQPAANVAALVPAYLKAVPRDTETGKEIQEIPPPVKN